MSFSGYIEWLSDGNNEFPHFVFSADTDMATSGLLSLSSTSGKEIFLCRLTTEEYAANEAGAEAAAQRINVELGRADLRVTKLLRVEQHQGSAGGSFQSFLRSYQPPTVIYQSIFGTGLEARAVRRQEPEEFISQGGRIQWVRS